MNARSDQLNPPIDPNRDHVLGLANAEMTLVQYGSYADFRSRAVHAVVEDLRNCFGDRMRYVFRHLPVEGKPAALRAAQVVERIAAATGKFWEVHEKFMELGPTLSDADIDQAAREHGVDAAVAGAGADGEGDQAAACVREDIDSARRSGATSSPTFYINGRRYRGTWDESSLADAMLAPMGHRIQAAAFKFVHWGPGSGFLLGLATLLALVLSTARPTRRRRRCVRRSLESSVDRSLAAGLHRCPGETGGKRPVNCGNEARSESRGYVRYSAL